MAAKIKVGSVKRFGVRYGTKVRNKLGMVEIVSKKNHKCPYCNSLTVKKVSNGIFSCSKCKAKFTGRAYAPIKKLNPVELEADQSSSEAVSEEETNEEDEDYSDDVQEEEASSEKTEKKQDNEEEQESEDSYTQEESEEDIEEDDSPKKRKVSRRKNDETD
jgi:large subunit ribosomal protein L37Ae